MLAVAVGKITGMTKGYTHQIKNAPIAKNIKVNMLDKINKQIFFISLIT